MASLLLMTILFLSFFPVMMSLTPPVGGITRPAFGVDFNFLYPINNMHGSWKHTWTIDLNLLSRHPPDVVSPSVNCKAAYTKSCAHASDFVVSLSKALQNVTTVISDTFIWAQDPQILATMNRQFPTERKKRALLPFVGDIEKFFFGVATESDIAALKASIDDMEQLHGKSIREVTNLGDNLASLTKTVGENLANTEKGFNVVKYAISNLTISANKHFAEMQDAYRAADNRANKLELDIMMLYDVLTDSFPALIHALSVTHADIQLLQGLQTIIQGYIPISLIPPKDLIAGLEVAEQGIKAKFPQASLSYPKSALGYYYTHKIVTPYIESERVSLIVDIPVDLGQEILYVYAIRPFPVELLPYNPYTHIVDPASRASRAQSLLMPGTSNFLITPEGDFWSTATDSELQLCKGETIYFCPKQFPLYKFTGSHCLEQLWKDSTFESILEVCHYELIHVKNPVKQFPFVSVTSLSNGRWFIQAPLTGKWTITCPNRPPEVRDPCSSCVISVDCGCGVNSDYFKIPTRISACVNVFSPLSRNYTLNPFNYLPAKNPWVVNLTGDSSVHTEPKWLPDITIPDNGNWDDVMESMESKKFDLNRLYLKTVNETKMYKTEAEALLAKLKNQDKFLESLSSWPDWIIGLVITLTFVNSGVIALCCFCFFARARALPTMSPETSLITSIEYELISVEVVNLCLNCVIIFLLLLMVWPVISNWWQGTNAYRKVKSQTRKIKASGYRNRRGWVNIVLEGNLRFQGFNVVLGRTQVLAGSTPIGTKLATDNPEQLLLRIDPIDGFYKFVFVRGVKLIHANGEERMVESFPIAADYVHRKLDVPITSPLIGFDEVQMWIDKRG